MIVAGLFAAVSFIASRLLNPPRPTEAKNAPYECGIVDQTPTPERFPVRFYLIAMIFIVFDIEIIFFYPFTTVFRQLGAFGLGAIIVFALAVFESFVYLIANGALDWGPRKIQRRSELMIHSSRTTRTTVKRVGLTGRVPESPSVGTEPELEPEPELAPAHEAA